MKIPAKPPGRPSAPGSTLPSATERDPALPGVTARDPAAREATARPTQPTQPTQPAIRDRAVERAFAERTTALEAGLVVSPSADTMPDDDDARRTARSPTHTASLPLLDAELPADRYQEAETLGAGGMGEVRVLRDGWIGRDVARKVMRPELAASGKALARFLREIRVQGQLEHPSIVPVYDVGRSGPDELYFTMRRIQGMTLGAVIEGIARGDEALVARFSRRKLLTAFSSVCMAVHYAHSRGVVHRDLKPQNIMLGEYGEVYVLDWGIAKLVKGGGELSEVGRVVGTLGYMAPEQARGGAVDAQADVYALGVILFEMLAGEHVFAGMDSSAVMDALAKGTDARPTDRKGAPTCRPSSRRSACARRRGSPAIASPPRSR